MDPKVAVAVSFALILEERASVSQDNYVHSSYYDASIPVSGRCERLKRLSRMVLQGQKIPNDLDSYDLLCKVTQAYRLQVDDFRSQFFVEVA